MILELVDADLGTLTLTHTGGYLVEEFDAPAPTIRAVEQDFPQNHGVIDNTAYYGTRVLTMNGKLLATPNVSLVTARQRLNQYLVPWKRPTLRWILEDSLNTVYETTVRIDRADLQVRLGHDVFSVSWKADPFWYSPRTYNSIPFGGGDLLGGDAWPWLGTDPAEEWIDFTDAISAGANLINNGVVSTPPTFAVYGPIINPQLRNITTGKTIIFSSLTLLDGQVLDIDVRARTAIVDRDTNVFTSLNFEGTTWWELAQGNNYVALASFMAPGGEPFASVSWQDRFL